VAAERRPSHRPCHQAAVVDRPRLCGDDLRDVLAAGLVILAEAGRRRATAGNPPIRTRGNGSPSGRAAARLIRAPRAYSVTCVIRDSTCMANERRRGPNECQAIAAHGAAVLVSQ
jgi:hypothetical protein